MVKSSKRAVVLGIVVAVVVLAGCLGGISPDIEEDRDAEEIQEAAIVSMDGVESHSFEMDMSVSAGISSMTMSTEGAVDYVAEKMVMTGSMSMMGTNEEFEMYVVGDTVYMQIMGMWETETVESFGEDGFWEEEIEQQQAYLEMAEVELNETTTLEDGTPVNVLDIHIDEEALLGELETQEDFDPEAASIDSLEFRQYLGVEDDLPYKVVMNIEMSDSGSSASLETEMYFSEFGEDVDIDLPADAPAP